MGGVRPDIQGFRKGFGWSLWWTENPILLSDETTFLKTRYLQLVYEIHRTGGKVVVDVCLSEIVVQSSEEWDKRFHSALRRTAFNVN